MRRRWQPGAVGEMAEPVALSASVLAELPEPELAGGRLIATNR